MKKKIISVALSAAMILSTLRFVVTPSGVLVGTIDYTKPIHSAQYMASIERTERTSVGVCDDAPSIEIVEDISIDKSLDAENETVESLPLSDWEIDLIALVTMAEAESEPELGQRLVIDTILNRSRLRNASIHDVIYAPHQFSSMWNGRVDRCYVTDEIRQLVIEELRNQCDYEVVYFTADHYGKYGEPMFSVGNHYFCK